MFIQTCVILYLDVDIFISFHIFAENELNEANQTKALFEADGKSVAAWAREYRFPVGLVYRVLRGEAKCLRGTSHEIAVALKLKHAVSDAQREKLISLGISDTTLSTEKKQVAYLTIGIAHITSI